MTQEQKARAYDEALTTAKRIISKNCSEVEKLCLKCIFPALSESDDERVRMWLLDYVIGMIACLESDISHSTYDGIKGHDPEAEAELAQWQKARAYLEKQKYNRLQPIYDNQESFESALDKAWKSYNDSGARTVDGCEDNYTECAYAKGFREGYLFGLEKKKDLDKMIVVSPEVWDKAIADAYENGKKDGEKQKEHQFCPDAPKEKSVGGYFLSSSHKDKNLDEIAQDYVDGVKEFNPEPTWDLMQTAVCYGYHYCEQKEQEPAWSEEDEIMIGSLINYFEGDALDCSLDCVVNWLKSLRPSWRPSEQEKGALRTAIYVLTEERNFPKAAKQLQAILDAFDGKGSRKDWKPSDEQLRPLEYAIDYFKKKRNDTTYLESLYNDLKKLM